MFIKRIFLNSAPELGFGLLLTFGSGIGQTFFISLFSGEIRNELNLSHGIFGTFYSAATLVSSVIFLWFGKFTDQFNLTLTGAITLGFVQQITRAFGRVEGSLQYLVKSWSTIVELISVWKRLREFEAKLNLADELGTEVS